MSVHYNNNDTATFLHVRYSDDGFTCLISFRFRLNAGLRPMLLAIVGYLPICKQLCSPQNSMREALSSYLIQEFNGLLKTPRWHIKLWKFQAFYEVQFRYKKMKWKRIFYAVLASDTSTHGRRKLTLSYQHFK